MKDTTIEANPNCDKRWGVQIKIENDKYAEQALSMGWLAIKEKSGTTKDKPITFTILADI